MQQKDNSEEIDLLHAIRQVWCCRRFVLVVTIVFSVTGILFALFLPVEYKASCEMVPQTSSTSEFRQMSSLASLVGVEIGSMEEHTISPFVYENILSSVVFRKELLSVPISSESDSAVMSLRDYLLRDWEAPDELSYPPYNDRIESISAADYLCFQELDNRIQLTLDDGKGLLTIDVLMPERVMAAQVAQATVELLQRYITRMKIEKVESNLAFVQQRYDEARRRFESIQARRARFRDSNRNTISYVAQTELEKLDAEYTLATDIYRELAMQLELARIKVKETMPVLTIISPVAIPFYKNKPQRIIIIIIFAIAGVVVGVLAVLMIPPVVEVTEWRSLLKLLPKECLDGCNDGPGGVVQRNEIDER